MDYKFSFLDTIHSVQIERKDESFHILLDNNREYKATGVIVQPNVISFKLNDSYYHVYLVTGKDKTYLSVDGEYFIFEPGKEKITRAVVEDTRKGNSVSSPMPGLLVKVPVSIGDKVTSGTTLAVVEAMKTQNELQSPRDGIVKKIHAKEGDQVDALQVIVELE